MWRYEGVFGICGGMWRCVNDVWGVWMVFGVCGGVLWSVGVV